MPSSMLTARSIALMSPMTVRCLVPEHNVRHDRHFGLPAFHDPVVELELVDGVDQIVLLVPDVHAVEDRQQVAFDDLVARMDLPKDRSAFFRCAGDLLRSVRSQRTRPKMAKGRNAPASEKSVSDRGPSSRASPAAAFASASGPRRSSRRCSCGCPEPCGRRPAQTACGAFPRPDRPSPSTCRLSRAPCAAGIASSAAAEGRMAPFAATKPTTKTTPRSKAPTTFADFDSKRRMEKSLTILNADPFSTGRGKTRRLVVIVGGAPRPAAAECRAIWLRSTRPRPPSANRPAPAICSGAVRQSTSENPRS